MSNAYGQSGQGGLLTIGSIPNLKTTRMKLRKAFTNADTTVSDDGWGKLCPIFRDWFVDVEMPCRTADASDTIADAFDTNAYDTLTEDVAIPEVTFTLPNGDTWTGYGMLDGEVAIDSVARDAVRISFTVKGSGPLTAS